MASDRAANESRPMVRLNRHDKYLHRHEEEPRRRSRSYDDSNYNRDRSCNASGRDEKGLGKPRDAKADGHGGTSPGEHRPSHRKGGDIPSNGRHLVPATSSDKGVRFNNDSSAAMVVSDRRNQNSNQPAMSDPYAHTRDGGDVSSWPLRDMGSSPSRHRRRYRSPSPPAPRCGTRGDCYDDEDDDRRYRRAPDRYDRQLHTEEPLRRYTQSTEPSPRNNGSRNCDTAENDIWPRFQRIDISDNVEPGRPRRRENHNMRQSQGSRDDRQSDRRSPLPSSGEAYKPATQRLRSPPPAVRMHDGVAEYGRSRSGGYEADRDDRARRREGGPRRVRFSSPDRHGDRSGGSGYDEHYHGDDSRRGRLQQRGDEDQTPKAAAAAATTASFLPLPPAFFPLSEAAKNALRAGAMAVLVNHGAPGTWVGDKGKQVATAALGAALVDTYIGYKYPAWNNGVRHTALRQAAEYAIGSMVAEPLLKRVAKRWGQQRR